MRTHSIRMLGFAFATMTLAATPVIAQGNGRSVMQVLRDDAKRDARADRDIERDREKEIKRQRKEIERAQREADRRRDDRVYDQRVYGNGRKIPPGLAKKPGQMPPGQYKKRYGTNQGASVLGDILRRDGYSVLRTVPRDGSQYVYYRGRDGSERRAIVSQGTDRIGFSNVPQTVLQQVLSVLY
jgi:hypothetical protein